MRAAKRVLSILKDRAEAVQGTVAAEILAGISEAQTASGDVFSKQPEIVPHVTVYDSHVHAILFTVLLIDGIRITANLFYTQFLLYTLGLALYALSVGLVIVALIRQRNTNLPSVAKGMTWCALIYLWISAAAWYVYGIIASIDRPDAGLNYWKLLQSISERPVLESVPQLILHSFSAFCSLVFGLGGLISVWKFYDRGK
jgi:hypothetical protein